MTFDEMNKIDDLLCEIENATIGAGKLLVFQTGQCRTASLLATRVEADRTLLDQFQVCTDCLRHAINNAIEVAARAQYIREVLRLSLDPGEGSAPAPPTGSAGS